ncbi:hypothetical protein [Polaromonas sp. P5_D5]
MVEAVSGDKSAQSPSRRRTLSLGKKEIALPIFFPSISSVKTQSSPISYFQVINSVFKGKQFLISAYDLIRTDPDARLQLLQERETAADDETLVLMDSGNYESFWRGPAEPWTVGEYHEALAAFKPDVAFGFDDQSPPENESEHLRLWIEQFRADQHAAGTTLVIPIIHGDARVIAGICARFVKASSIKYVAVPERCLGSDLFERVRTVASIRRSLNELGSYVFLHLLGTGNPLSLALFSEAGADTFDGLEWCQTAVDYQTNLLHHFPQGVLFLQQGRWAASALPYEIRILAHNLDFLANWNELVRKSVIEGSVDDLIDQSFSSHIYRQCQAEGVWR